MAFRALIIGLFWLLVAIAPASHASACFGPKLFVGVSAGAEHDLLYALVTLYVKEKTGVESIRVDIDKQTNPLKLITDDEADMVFVVTKESLQNAVLNVKDFPALVAGKRPLEELQFTTVLPAVKKLDHLLKNEDVQILVNKVKTGKSAMAVAREFFMENRWI